MIDSVETYVQLLEDLCWAFYSHVSYLVKEFPFKLVLAVGTLKGKKKF